MLCDRVCGVAEIASDRVVVKLTEQIRFQRCPLAGIDAMAAATTHTFPRHTHDQYGMGVIDSGGHSSSSGRGQAEAGPGGLIFANLCKFPLRGPPPRGPRALLHPY